MATTNTLTTPAIHFKYFALNENSDLIINAINQIEYSEIKITYCKNEQLNYDISNIFVFDVNDLTDKNIDIAFKVKKDFNHNPIILVYSEEPILLSTLARMGLTEIFVIPSELQKLKFYLKTITDNLSIKLLARKIDKQKIETSDFNDIIGKSKAIKKILNQAKSLAINYKVDLLILGETGTGKGLLARSIHKNSPIADAPFVPINCSAIPENLLESELFGYEPGAFTDAKNRKIGLFEFAKNGTIFLDEIGDLSPNLQVKILDVLDRKVIRRLGGVKDIPIKARIIAATNKDLLTLVEQKLFRRDLYHRLEVVTIELPPLRKREKDVLILAQHFIKEAVKKFNKPHLKMSKEMELFLLKYNWPGNVRELRNAIERAVLLSESSTLEVNDLFNLLGNKTIDSILDSSNILNLQFNEEGIPLDEINKLIVRQVLRKFQGNKTKTAKYLHISRPRLDRILK